MGTAAAFIPRHLKDLALYSCFQIQNQTVVKLYSELLLNSHKYKERKQTNKKKSKTLLWRGVLSFKKKCCHWIYMHVGTSLRAAFTLNVFTSKLYFCVLILAEVLHDKGWNTYCVFARLKCLSNAFYTHKLTQISLD